MYMLLHCGNIVNKSIIGLIVVFDVSLQQPLSGHRPNTVFRYRYNNHVKQILLRKIITFTHFTTAVVVSKITFTSPTCSSHNDL